MNGVVSFVPETNWYRLSSRTCGDGPRQDAFEQRIRNQSSQDLSLGHGQFTFLWSRYSRLQTMHRRLIVIAVLLATVLQGPVLTYAAATLATNGSHTSATQACGGLAVLDEKTCERCCGQGPMPSCLVQCAVALGAAIPMMSETSFWITVHGKLLPEAGAAPFPERDPSHPFRPPIV